MAKTGTILTAKFVENVRKKPNGRKVDKYHDKRGMGLFLLVKESGSKQWKQRIRTHGRRVELGLGSYPLVSLTEARDKALKNYQEAKDGQGYIVTRRAMERREAAAEALRSITTFKTLAIQRHEEMMANKAWGNDKHGKQVIATLEKYIFPIFGDMPICQIGTRDIKKALMQPIGDEGSFWLERAETARRVRQRMSDVFKLAIVEGLRKDNPVDHVEVALPPQRTKKKNHKALPYQQVSGAIATVKASDCRPVTALAFEALVLTATRSGEIRLARWREIDFEGALWTIPAERMKADKEHKIPLSDRMLDILEEMKQYSRPEADNLIFCSTSPDRPLSDNTLSKLMRDCRIDAVPHGYRASFRTWTQEVAKADDDVAEACLAHTIQNKVKAAYARADHLDARRVLMQDWADYLA